MFSHMFEIFPSGYHCALLFEVIAYDKMRLPTPYKVHYFGWNEKWDEWVKAEQLKPHLPIPSSLAPTQKVATGQPKNRQKQAVKRKDSPDLETKNNATMTSDCSFIHTYLIITCSCPWFDSCPWVPLG